jgi:hypothetical protein
MSKTDSFAVSEVIQEVGVHTRSCRGRGAGYASFGEDSSPSSAYCAWFCKPGPTLCCSVATLPWLCSSASFDCQISAKRAPSHKN